MLEPLEVIIAALPALNVEVVLAPLRPLAGVLPVCVLPPDKAICKRRGESVPLRRRVTARFAGAKVYRLRRPSANLVSYEARLRKAKGCTRWSCTRESGAPSSSRASAVGRPPAGLESTGARFARCLPSPFLRATGGRSRPQGPRSVPLRPSSTGSWKGT
jgi:hypothetical protein